MLARRTLLRGVKLGLPSGQDLAAGARGAAARRGGPAAGDGARTAQTREALAAATPLWYWILCEAEKAGGEQLGPLGRSIVGEVLPA